MVQEHMNIRTLADHSSDLEMFKVTLEDPIEIQNKSHLNIKLTNNKN